MVPNNNVAEWLDPKVLVAIYAAIVATIALAWNIFSAIIMYRSKIVVHIFIEHRFFTQGVLSGKLPPVLTAKITNMSRIIRIINKPEINISKAIEYLGMDGKSFQVFEQSQIENYPKELKSGEVINYSVELDSFWKDIGSKLDNKDKVWVNVKDTFGKLYKSNKIKLTDIKLALQITSR